QIVGLQPDNRWQDLARESYVDDLESQRRRLTASLLAVNASKPQEAVFTDWQVQQQPLIVRWQSMVRDLRRGTTPDFAMISVALRELLDLVQASVEASQTADKSG
ncbi:NAD-glutamate dehydrogenase, partial [Porticoccaceae bacterium]|nr:NAD-glutamate dehydrogenase [Porticoccaceae bacterium]